MKLLRKGTRVYANETTDLFAGPGKEKIGDIAIETQAEVVEQSSDNLFTALDTGFGADVVWIETRFVDVDTLPAPPAQFETEEFVDECVAVARLVNEMPDTTPTFIDAEAIVARALYQSGMKDVSGTVGQENVRGPLQVTKAEWKAFLASKMALAEGYGTADKDLPLAQIRAAAWTMLRDARSFTVLRKPPRPEDQPLAPSYVELVLAQILDGAENVEKVVAALAAKPDDALEDALRTIAPPAALQGLLARVASRLKGPLPTGPGAAVVADLSATLKSRVLDAQQLVEKHEGTTPVKQSAKVKILDSLPKNLVAVPKADPVPFAEIGGAVGDLFWPVATSNSSAMVISYRAVGNSVVGGWGREFLANRRGRKRHHVGLDIYCDEGDVVVACAAGRIVSFFDFYQRPTGEHTYALLVEHDGVVINYGEVRPSAPKIFGWRVGDDVDAGQRLAHVSGTNMIHFETYVPGTERTYRWMAGERRPAALRNPTKLLFDLALGAKRKLPDGQQIASSGRGVLKTVTGFDARGRDLLTLARTIYGEARGETHMGRVAVANVVMNRVRRGPRRYAATVWGVCQQKAQFSCWNANDPNRKIIERLLPGANTKFDDCCKIADLAVKEVLDDVTNGATHYYASYIAAPSWASAGKLTVQIGRHKFFAGVP